MSFNRNQATNALKIPMRTAINEIGMTRLVVVKSPRSSRVDLRRVASPVRLTFVSSAVALYNRASQLKALDTVF
jgi:hypothetical protein